MSTSPAPACLRQARDQRVVYAAVRELLAEDGMDSAQTPMQRLGERLQLAVAAGRLRHDDPHFMGELLLSMIVGMDFERQRLHTAHRSGAAAQRAWAEFAVVGFLRAFAARPSLSFSKPDRSTAR